STREYLDMAYGSSTSGGNVCADSRCTGCGEVDGICFVRTGGTRQRNADVLSDEDSRWLPRKCARDYLRLFNSHGFEGSGIARRPKSRRGYLSQGNPAQIQLHQRQTAECLYRYGGIAAADYGAGECALGRAARLI